MCLARHGRLGGDCQFRIAAAPGRTEHGIDRIAWLSSRQLSRDVRQRLMIADAAGYPTADVLLAFSDYSSAIESAPESVPYAYAMRADHLNERWADYQRDRYERRAKRGQKP